MAKPRKTNEAAERLRRWRQPGAAGFFAFLEDVKPRIPSAKGGYEPYTIPSDEVRAEIEKALDGGFMTLVFCWPRRHGKSVVVALIIVWRFMIGLTENIALVANSERQAVDTVFKLVRTALEHTPYMKARVAGHRDCYS